MNAAVDFPDVQYAVIEGLRTETGHEHIVIAYPSEKSLRDLFAAPSIVAFGFATRDEAIVAGGASFTTAVADQRTTETNGSEQGLNWAKLQGVTGSLLRRLAKFLVTSYGEVVISLIVIFSSGNTISTAIRMALGSSV
jgi:hypothetical protein